MLANTIRIYAISGWAFNSSIMNILGSELITISLLDYSNFKTIDEATYKLADQIPENSILLGWSFGGLIAIKLAKKYPQKVSKLILLNSQPKLMESNGWSGIQSNSAKKFIDQLKYNFHSTLNKFSRLTNFTNGLAYQHTITTYLQTTKPAILFEQLHAFLYADLRDDYQFITSPILHLIGAKDAILTQQMDLLSLLNPHTTTHRFKMHGHSSFIKHKTLYQKKILSFIYEKQKPNNKTV